MPRLSAATVALASAAWTGSTAVAGTSNQKREPWPSLVSTPIWPSMASIRPLQMARPRPVPPKVRVDEPSIWEKRWNRAERRSSLMPGPVSVTEADSLSVSPS